jgi:hypothetical protein
MSTAEDAARKAKADRAKKLVRDGVDELLFTSTPPNPSAVVACRPSICTEQSLEAGRGQGEEAERDGPY